MAANIIKERHYRQKERAEELQERGKAREDAVVAVREAWRKDQDTSKEIKSLKK